MVELFLQSVFTDANVVLGEGITDIVVMLDGKETQLFCVCVTEKLPPVFTTIVRVLAPLDQLLPDKADEVSVRLFPEQTLTVPIGVINGADGIGLTVSKIIELVAVFGLEQGELEVMTQFMGNVPVSAKVVKIGLLGPTLLPLNCH
jgi:hypothetical protein